MSCPNFKDCLNKNNIEHLEEKLDCLQDSYDSLFKIVSNHNDVIVRNDEKVKSIFDKLEKIDKAVEGINKNIGSKEGKVLSFVLSILMIIFSTVLGSAVTLIITKAVR